MERATTAASAENSASLAVGAARNVARVDEFDLLRAREYALLATLLGSPPTADLLSRLAKLDGDASPLGWVHHVLAAAARQAEPAAVEREYFELFVGVARGELLPYASYYLTGFLNERPLALVREALASLCIERSEENPEPEDHIATLCEVMAGLASGDFPADAAMHRRFFERHLQPWAGDFFADVESARAARFYSAVGALGRVLVEIEAEALTME